MMNAKLIWGLAICLAGPICMGCAGSPGVIRGQSPAGGSDTSPSIRQASYESHVHSAPMEGDVCPECGCRDGSCGHCHPKHRFWYHYSPPGSGRCCLSSMCPCRDPLVYPSNPTPGALVQYPYYTVKGPDDFFYPPVGTNNGR